MNLRSSFKCLIWISSLKVLEINAKKINSFITKHGPQGWPPYKIIVDKRINRSTNIGDMAERDKRPVSDGIRE